MIAKTKATATGTLLPAVLAYTSSLADDMHLVREDLVGSLAHLAMLESVALVSHEDASAIREELVQIAREAEDGALVLPSEEDVHMAIEARLTQKLGERAGALHTARSRNDQIALDLTLFVRSACAHVSIELATTLEHLADRAERDRAIILPAYTHRQRAMPITGGFFWASYGAMLERSVLAFVEARHRADVMPLGAGAIAGTSLPIDRAHVCAALAFDRVTTNAMDTVSNRDFEIDFVYACARVMSHVARIASDVIDFSSSEFGFLELGDAISCGSSMMPQKKNPDLFELLRGKSARVQGDLVSLLTLGSKLPSGYGRDLQEDRRALFGAKSTVLGALPMLRLGIDHVAFDRARCLAAVESDYMQATDIAEALVLRHEVPFRTAYGVVGLLVKLARETNVPLSKITVAEAQRIDPRLDAEVMVAADARTSAARKTSAGGTAPERVDEQIERIRKVARDARTDASRVPMTRELLARLIAGKNG